MRDIINLRNISDSRGVLTVIESEKDIPFSIKRVFFMHHVVQDRGGHAHVDTDQLLIAAHGSFDLTLDDGTFSETIHLNDPEVGVYVPRLTFVAFSNLTFDAVCLVLASTHYDINKSLRSYEAFLNYISRNKLG
jgi:hypothetical protein